MELTLSWLWYHGIFYVLWLFMVYYLINTVIYIKNSPWFSSKDEYIQIYESPAVRVASIPEAEDDIPVKEE